MTRFRHAKIVATLGPASGSEAAIGRLVAAGADVFRFNLSHGSHDDHRRRYAAVRALEARHGRPIAVLGDLQGPKLRLGALAGGALDIAAGDRLTLDLDPAPGDSRRIPLPHPEVFAALAKDAELLVDDGKVRLRVLRAGRDHADVEVVAGNRLSDRKGVNLPSAVLPISALTNKDRRDLAFALDLGCDWIALSFVQRPDDVAEAKKLVGGRAGVMAKLEKPAALDRLEEIVELSDAVMVARGDLGVEMPPESVPGQQKRIVRACRHAGKPVVVATQMLESMVSSPAPTRAEASDVATAIYDGADAVMLSAETAVGQYSAEAVAMMARIAAVVEADPIYRVQVHAAHETPEATSADAITAAARQVAETLGAAAIVTYTTSGSTTLRAARERPAAPIVCLTPRVATARRLALAWGVYPVITEDAHDFDDMVSRAVAVAAEAGFAAPGDHIAITAGVPFGTPGATNLLRLARVPG
ncbi:MAG: pyruvate kinase [Alphaproteobacteria bacterium]|nr:pyruvate kinase [Alphaproteobacteria bacterium]